MPYVWAHKVLFFKTKRQTETTSRTARKFLTNAVEQISNRRVLGSINAKWRLGAVPQADELLAEFTGLFTLIAYNHNSLNLSLY